MKTAVMFVLGLGACSAAPTPPPSLPPVVDHGGPVLHHVSLAVVSYQGDPLEARERQFAQFLVGSQWLGEVGAAYGVHGDQYVGGYEVTRAAPASLTVDELMADVTATVPMAASATVDGDPPIYLIYLPHSTTLTGSPGGVQCTDWFAYHGQYSDGRIYAVMGDCNNSGMLTGYNSSHEIIEAATNPTDQGWYVDAGADWQSPWAHHSEEVGDLCQPILQYIHEGDFQLTRAWSVDAADATRPDPCVPVPAGDVYVGVSVDPPTDTVYAPADFTLTGWSSGPTDDWPITVTVPSSGPQFIATLSSPTIGDGKQVTLHIDPPTDPITANEPGVVLVASPDADQPVGVNYPLVRGTDRAWR
jgi:hypothetical protein